MTDPSGATADTPQTTIAERAREATRRLGDLDDRQKAENELGAISLTTKRAEELVTNLRKSAAIADDLQTLGVDVSSPSLPPTVTKAIRDLRTAATVADDPGQPLTDRLRGSAVQEALKAAENTSKTIDQGLRSAADGERLRLMPSDLDDPVVALPGSESVQLKVFRLRASFSDRLRQEPVAGLPAIVNRWRTDAVEWAKLRKTLEDLVDQLHPEIRTFVEAAASDNGARWSLLTPMVREWLDTNDNGEGYGVRKW